ncbi:DUF6492 family protein [Acuticoccus mangrovi]|uniref:Uncharacterized protein n=1 Tax=Acuticoccus mangrovi TaxID=2796142 RepID=A0A934MCZ1_9HYPH|nr:DUF6492 family protein [Acuticoccus mangrovi]MBJ3775782.1 hypothetical protein [Acuticoccus mangrovi]
MRIELQTCSYAGDFGLCEMLCETIDRFAPADMRHVLIVPTADLAVFRPLERSGREVRSEDEYLPRWLHRLPIPRGSWRRYLMLPRRDIFLSFRSAPVRGWIVQQMIKIGATRASEADVVLHVDSDTAFVRPFTEESLVVDGKVRCYRNPGAGILDTHALWHEAASRLLGLPPTPYHGADFIDAMVTWRRDTARAMIDRIESTTGVDWQVALARTPHFSEYILYGVYATKIAEAEPATAGRLWFTERSLSRSLWTEGLADEAHKAAFVASLEPDEIACLVQSTLPMSAAERRALIEDLAAVAARQQAG